MTMKVDLPESTAGATPPSGKVALYAKTDGFLYSKDDLGVETQLGGGSVTEPANQMVYGTGSGVDSDADFTWDPTSNQLRMGTSLNSLLMYGFSLQTTITTENGLPAQNTIDVILKTGDAQTTGTTGNLIIQSGSSTDGTAGTLSLRGGSSSGTGTVGGVNIDAGLPTNANGGNVGIAASAGVGLNRSGGNVNITGGAATGAGTAGSINFLTSATTRMTITSDINAIGTTSFTFPLTDAGYVNRLRPALSGLGWGYNSTASRLWMGSTSGTAGALVGVGPYGLDFYTQPDVTGGSGGGGPVAWTTGAGHAGAPETSGGSFTITLGSASGTSNGGNFTLTAGAGGTTGTAGTVTITGGAGGSTSGAGGNVIIKGGNITSGDIGSVALGRGTTSTSRNGDMMYVPSSAGIPTGTPATISGLTPIIVDTTGHNVWFYSGGAWRGTIRASTTHNFASISSNTSADHTFTVTGAALGDVVSLGLPVLTGTGTVSDVIFNAFVSSANNVTLRAFNPTGGAVDLDSLTYNVIVTKY